jgi:hypothetical protein
MSEPYNGQQREDAQSQYVLVPGPYYGVLRAHDKYVLRLGMALHLRALHSRNAGNMDRARPQRLKLRLPRCMWRLGTLEQWSGPAVTSGFSAK